MNANTNRNSKLITLQLIVEALTGTRDVNEFARSCNQMRDTRTHEFPWTLDDIREVAFPMGYYAAVQQGWNAQTAAQLFIANLVADAEYGCFGEEGNTEITVSREPRRRPGTSPKAVAKLRELCRQVEADRDVNRFVAEITALRVGPLHDAPWTWEDVNTVYQEYGPELPLRPDFSDEVALLSLIGEVVAPIVWNN